MWDMYRMCVIPEGDFLVVLNTTYLYWIYTWQKKKLDVFYLSVMSWVLRNQTYGICQYIAVD